MKFMLQVEGSVRGVRSDWTPVKLSLSKNDKKRVMWYRDSYITDTKTGNMYHAIHFSSTTKTVVRLRPVKFIPNAQYEVRA